MVLSVIESIEYNNNKCIHFHLVNNTLNGIPNTYSIFLLYIVSNLINKKKSIVIYVVKINTCLFILVY